MACTASSSIVETFGLHGFKMPSERLSDARGGTVSEDDAHDDTLVLHHGCHAVLAHRERMQSGFAKGDDARTLDRDTRKSAQEASICHRTKHHRVPRR